MAFKKNPNKIEPWQLAQRQSLPLAAKVQMSEIRIRAWYSHWRGNVYVAFSGGKDSTVLLDMVQKIYPRVPAVFCDTGLEFPEIRDFVKTFDNVVWLKPKMNFRAVLKKYGYPVVSKRQAQYLHECQRTKSSHMIQLRTTGIRKNGTFSSMSMISKKWQYLINAPFKVSDRCCKIMKKDPSKKYTKETGRMPFVGTMASDGVQREKTYLQYGCNAFDLTSQPRSTPLAFWMEADIWAYIRENNLPYSPIYDMGYKRTGCVFCAFGAHLEGRPNRFERLHKTHPKLHRYCMKTLGMQKVLDYCHVATVDKQLTFDIDA